MVEPEYRMSDADGARFIVSGYHLVEPDLPADLSESIAAQLDQLDHNPGDGITDVVPDLQKSP